MRRWLADPHVKPEKGIVMSISAALLCLATTVYFEARGEPFQGQVAVAYVTHNRAKIKGKSYCDIVYEAKQFSWTRDKGLNDVDFQSKAWEQAVHIAKNFNKWKDVSGGATHFHSVKVYPVWRHNLALSVGIGNHLFYR